ncbi:MAG TPA: aldehyde dehydrogenase family protein [Dyella sp.]|uniref:aldehyde dehydrogenase family protein n=1 Tax=Dyella sp. TaxID=1869338 RepID=UPI002BC0CE3A|nr:aldehyde dehydrogenase family protein [Dyella sp.]HTV85015.1 aldehyde dehydrogenase family protein [Dyella sp.]
MKPLHFKSMVYQANGKEPARDVKSPFDGSVVGTVGTASAEDIERALATAYRLFKDRRGWLPAMDREAILRRAAQHMTEMAEDLSMLIALEGGKPLIDARAETARAIDGILSCAQAIRDHGGHVIPMNVNASSAHRMAFTQREPIGVVVAVSAFNHPLNLIVHQVGPAVAAGCPFIVKPATDTPLSCLTLVDILREAGLPEAWGQAIVVEDNELASRLVTDARVGFFSFIGSAGVGWKLRSLLAPGTRCALEHGGAAPVIVAADADLDKAIPKLIKGGFYHAGQVCVSVQRVYVHQSMARDVADRLARAAEALVVGDPTKAETHVGPLIRKKERDRVQTWVQNAVAAGAQLVTGGKPVGETCYAPTILFAPPPECEVSQKEVFGPVVCVYPYDDIEQAFAAANALPVAFQAAVFTRDFDTAIRAFHSLDGSAVMVNEHTAFRVDWMPFAGLRESGLGVGGIPYTFHDMQIEKMFVGVSP